MRILALSSPGGGICGIGDYNAELSSALRDLGHHVDILKLVRRGDRTSMVQEFRQRIADFDAVIMHYDGPLYGDTPAAISRNVTNLIRAMGSRPGIAVLHEEPIRLRSRKMVKSWMMRRAMLAALNRLTAFVHNEDIRSVWISKGIAPGQIRAITFPMQPSQMLVEPCPLGKNDTVELTMFGFVSEYKGYEIVLNAMRVLPENFVLTIAGDRAPGNWGDRTFDAIHGFIETGRWVPRTHYTEIDSVQRPYTPEERQSMQARIKFTGHVPTDRIAEIMNRADIVLLPYRHSCGSAAVADAIEFARPTVATAVPAFRELNAQANCLRLVSPDAPFELAHAIRELAGDFNERRRMFAAARTFARVHSFAALAQRCISSLDQVVDVQQETIAKDDFALGDDDSNPRWPPIETIRR